MKAYARENSTRNTRNNSRHGSSRNSSRPERRRKVSKDLQKQTAYILYMILGSYFHKCRCLSAYVEKNLLLYYREMKTTAQEELEELVILRAEEAMAAYAEVLGEENADVTISQQDGLYTVCFSTGFERVEAVVDATGLFRIRYRGKRLAASASKPVQDAAGCAAAQAVREDAATQTAGEDAATQETAENAGAALPAGGRAKAGAVQTSKLSASPISSALAAAAENLARKRAQKAARNEDEKEARKKVHAA